MLDGQPMTKEYYERASYHIDEVWTCICDNMAGDISFASNMMYNINERFFNILLTSEAHAASGYDKKEFISKIHKEFLKLMDKKLGPYKQDCH